jgi:hypothetical protein
MPNHNGAIDVEFLCRFLRANDQNGLGLLGEENRSWLLVRQTTMAIEIIHVVGQANNNENPKPASGGRHINRTLGEENRLELLVRRPATADYLARKIIHGCWSGKQPWQSKSFMLLVRQTTTKIQSPTPAGGILIDHWAKKIV